MVIPPVALRYLNIPLHPIRPKIAHMYEHRDRNSLWWRVSVQPLLQYRRVVRSWGARRARLAFQQALEERGFDREGRKILDDAGDEGLTGSVEIVVRPPCIKEKPPQIQEEMGSILDVLVEEHNSNMAKGKK